MNPIISERDALLYVSADLAWQYRVVPYKIEGNSLTLLIDKGAYKDALIGELELITGYDIILQAEENNVIDQLLSKIYRKNKVVSNIVTTDTQGKADDLLQKIIFEAKELKSSDIHIEGYADKCRIRLRIDGKLIERYQIPKDQYASFINKVKIKANLDIAEKRLPQDGRIMVAANGLRIDIRVSVLPVLYGEKVVLRLLNSDSSHIQLTGLGLDQKQLADFQTTLKKPHGILLISGPTGSGKTTTLYATLKQLNNDHTNILTIEDPVEYTLDGVNQVQLKENIGLTFSSALRTFLRQDPDIIMLGEIRDAETAHIAIRAALTGHLVLSTIHTNSAWGTISRLADMGVPAFLLASTLTLTAAQRLVRKLCTHCKRQQALDLQQYPGIGDFLSAIKEHHVAIGCDHCYYTGYSGRIAIYEVIPIDAELSAMVKENVLNINEQLQQRNINTLKGKATELLKNGDTSLEELYPILLNY